MPHEKTSYVSRPNDDKKVYRKCLLFIVILLAYSVYLSFGCAQIHFHSSQNTDQNATAHLSWWTCPDVAGTQCTYLDVPRDYDNPVEKDTVSIFLRKIPATVPPEDYLGSILLNPGGPGGSGSGYSATIGFYLRSVVSGKYDIIGFDPRGVNMTLPALNCYQTEAQVRHAVYKRTLLGIPYEARGPRTLSPATRSILERIQVNKLDTSFTATRLACQEHGNRRMLESLSVALVVQDMERIVNALGEDGLNFWGFSFGTILGSTFAAMRPHLVKRMVLDGVSNAETYHKDIYQWGIDGMADTHKVLTGFLDSCAAAGPNRCTFARSPSKEPATSDDLRARLEKLYERLRSYPMPVSESQAGPGILTASDAKTVIFKELAIPQWWPRLANKLAAAEDGDPQPLYDSVYAEFGNITSGNMNENVFGSYMENFLSPVASAAIMCGDTETNNSKSLEDYISYVHELGRISPIGESWALMIGACRSWKLRAIQRYQGPWTVSEGLNKTRFPILYASLDADTTAPISAAEHMFKAFGNESASLLVQEGFGHGTMASPSLCSLRAFRNYFINGQVPLPGTECEIEPGRIFPGNTTVQPTSISPEDQELWVALEGLSNTNWGV